MFTSVATVDSLVRMLAMSYIRVVTSVPGNATWSIAELCPVASWIIATIVPSRSAPSAMRLRVAGRNEPTVNIAPRGTTSLTGRPSLRAAVAISTVCPRIVALLPNAPPT